MTSLRQLEANRRNALRSTGPSTLAGKDRSRRNAMRHGLCAETVVATVEDNEDYQAFEAIVVADFDAITAVERELVLRLASLLWRLRRATAIETGLLETHAERYTDNGDMHARALEELGNSLGLTPSSRALSQCFLKFGGADGTAFDRVSNYETALWRQLRQTLFALKSLSWQHDTAVRPRAKNTRWRSRSS